MARGAGLALKGVSLVFRVVEFCCAAVILALFSFFMADLHQNNRPIPSYEKAVEGISGVAIIYTVLAFLFVCCLGGITFFSFLAILLDLAFTAAFIYIAWANRNGGRGSIGVICTPLGCGDAQSDITDSSIRYITAHRMESAVLAVAIIGTILFFLNMFIEYGLMRHHKRERAFGPSPNNGYTAGSSKRKFWQRKDPEMAGGLAATKISPDALPPHTKPSEVARTSYAGTDTTTVDADPSYNKYGPTNPVGGQHTGYTTTATTHQHVPYARETGYAPGTAHMPPGNYHASGNANGTF